MFSFYTIGCLPSRKEHCFNWTRESLYGQQHPQQQPSPLILGSALWTLNPWRDGWLLPSIGMCVFSGRKRRIFGTNVPFRNMDLALTGISPYWIELCCTVGWQKRKKNRWGVAHACNWQKYLYSISSSLLSNDDSGSERITVPALHVFSVPLDLHYLL